jgi:hypothetical protein
MTSDRAIAILALACLTAAGAGAQPAPGADARAQARFRRFDANESGWLSGRELDACGCRGYDRDGNGEITWLEFYRGDLAAAVDAMSREAGLPVAKEPERLAPRLPAREPATPAPIHATYAIPDRVEVNYAGAWYPGSIYAAKDGRYLVDRDGYMTDDHWVTAAELRPLAPARRAERPGVRRPRELPRGAYTCTSTTAGFQSAVSTRSTLGILRITGADTYTRFGRDAGGGTYRYAYDAATGRLTWPGGLQGFFGRVEDSEASVAPDGDVLITVNYRVREGGSLFDLTCQRE